MRRSCDCNPLPQLQISLTNNNCAGEAHQHQGDIYFTSTIKIVSQLTFPVYQLKEKSLNNTIKMSQAGDNNNGAKKPDFGETFLGSAGSDAAPPMDQAPQALDHFKRGYSERAHNRDKDMSGFTNPDKPPMGGGGGPQKWQPPAGVKPNGGGGERPNNQYQPRPHQQQRNYNSYNNNYNKYDDKQYTRSCTYLPPYKTCSLSLFSACELTLCRDELFFLHSLYLTTFYNILYRQQI